MIAVIRRLALCSLLMALVLGCAVAPAPGGSGKVVESQIQRDRTPDAAAGEVETLALGNTAFAFDFYQEISSGDDNLFFSPYSLSTALAMVYAGARSGTEMQMAKTLHYDLEQARLHPAFNALDLAVTSGASQPSKEDAQPFQLSIANALWGQAGFEFHPEFIDRLALNYGAGLRLVDFQGDPEGVRGQINRWVEQQTQERIKDIVPPGALSSAARMALANAIYFKADWLTQFEPSNTREMPFNKLDGSQSPALFMSHAKPTNLEFYADSGLQAVQLPYQGGQVSMLLIVPEPGKFREIEAGLDVNRLAEILSGLQGLPVRLALPKFEYEAGYQLAETLSGMGMPDAFCGGDVDFSGMSSGPLCIGQVFHKAFVAVDEQGTEAAAASVIVMEVTAMQTDPVRQVLVDRPFIFLIRHNATGSILFAGRVVEPVAP